MLGCGFYDGNTYFHAVVLLFSCFLPSLVPSSVPLQSSPHSAGGTTWARELCRLCKSGGSGRCRVLTSFPKVIKVLAKLGDRVVHCEFSLRV